MPNDTTPLLPPDPEKPGRYWMTRTGWNIGERVEIWEWSPAEPLWRHEQWGPMSPDLAGKAGYTLATRHRIPSPAALEAIYAAAGQMHSEKEAARRTMNRSLIGGYDWREASTREAAFMAAYDMLRAALETKEDDKND